jgi:2-desacetyl-2-hydroxyethyl bacteriochlorophyllide A dehydrogenase
MSTLLDVAQAMWVVEPGRAEIRSALLPQLGPDDVLVRTRWSGISRGTESLVFRGAVPEGQREAMRAPFQEGNFPGPVKYGYLAVGEVACGPDDLHGRTVFCLHPHQDRFVVPAAAVFVVPDNVPARRAVLAGTVETAVNALWDAAPLIGDRVLVVGAGMVGCCIARLLSAMPGISVTLVDVNADRARVADALGVAFAAPQEAPGDADIVFHTSATAAGLQLGLDLLGVEGTVIELSWYGDAAVSIGLGGSFHSDRLTIRASQVGRVAPARRHRRTTRDRLELALRLLADPAFDVLLTGQTTLQQLPATLAAIADGSLAGLCHTVSYEG